MQFEQSNDYQFSQSSLELLERCITTANQPDAKWHELFRPNLKEIPIKEECTPIYDGNNTGLLSLKNIDSGIESEVQLSKQAELEHVERIGTILQAKPSNNLEYIIEQCNDQLLPKLAEKLSLHCIETICEDVLNTLDIRFEKILLHFYPVYIKLENSHVALNLLIRANKTYPDIVLTLTENLFLNTDIPSKYLEEFFFAADVKTRSLFLQAISVKEIPTEVFIHHLNTISYLYIISSHKTLEVQSFLLKGLLQSSQMCQEDKSYGRCLLAFFKGLNELDDQLNRHSLVKLLEYHKTPFKVPCETILKNLYKNQY